MSEVELPVAASGATALEVARRCAAEANRIMLEGLGHIKVAAIKGRGNVVTAVDLEVERVVTAVLREEYPEHAVLSEETAATTRSDGWMWVVDPVDGTKNYSRGIPHFAYTMALCLAEEPLLAVTTQPMTGDEFVAVAGGGCRVNGVESRVSDVGSVLESVVALDMGYDDARGREQLELALRLWPGMQSLRVSGSAALGPAYVAAGRWDLYVHRDLQPWDLAGGLLLVREAGGVITEMDGSPATLRSRAVVAGTPGAQEELMRTWDLGLGT